MSGIKRALRSVWCTRDMDHTLSQNQVHGSGRISIYGVHLMDLNNRLLMAEVYFCTECPCGGHKPQFIYHGLC